MHLDLEAPAAMRAVLAAAVRADPVYSRFQNVKVVTRANLITYRGPTMVANMLHAAAILLREGGDWDLFINISAFDYPLVSQDDLLYVFSGLLNFIEQTSDIGWKEAIQPTEVQCFVDYGEKECPNCVEALYWSKMGVCVLQYNFFLNFVFSIYCKERHKVLSQRPKQPGK